MRTTIRFPPLALPFAVLAGAATWVWCDIVHRLHHGPSLSPHEQLAVGSAAMFGAVVGAILGPRRPTEENPTPAPSTAWVTMLLLAAGLGAGLTVMQIIAPEDALGSGAIEGMISAAMLVPVASRLVAAQSRADQARRGSVVARTERRAVLSLLAASIAGLTTLALPAAIAALEGRGETPCDALRITAGAGALGLAVLIVDLVAALRVRRLDARIALGEGPATGVDFGLGDDVASRVEVGAPYRGGGRTVTLSVGDPLQARAALQRSIARGAIVLAFIELVALGHGLARDPEAAAMYEAKLCESGQASACRQAALLWERAGLPDEEATQLHQLACDAGVEKSCMAVYLLGRRALATP